MAIPETPMLPGLVHLDVTPRDACGFAPGVPESQVLFLNQLRLAAMQCRSKPREDLFRACALLTATRDDSFERHAQALVRCLPQALGKPTRLHAPGVAELSFDEKWLLQLTQTAAADDDSSFQFLLKSRVLAPHRRLVGFLMQRLTRTTTPSLY